MSTNQEEKYVLRHFPALFQNFPMLIIQDTKVINQKEKTGNIKSKSEQRI